MRTKLRSRLSLLFIALAAMIALPAAAALADNINDDIRDNVDAPLQLTAGDANSKATADVKIVGNSSDGDTDPGCNFDSSAESLTIKFDTPTGVTAKALDGATSTPGEMKFTACGVDQTVEFSADSSAAADNYTVTATVVDNATNGSFKSNVSIPIKVNAASTPSTPSDTTAPVLSLPSNITKEATGPNGAVVTYTATAQDAVDGSVGVNCTPSSGSTFPLGETTVNCSAKDAANNEATGSFKVTVVDTTPPTISDVPSNINATATSSSGALVNYTNPTASDLVSGTVAVNCLPTSGSQFPLGETTVNCSAKDAANNEAKASFKVNVTYAVAGILQPINGGNTLGDHSDDSSAFKLGSTVPVKFQLSGASSGIDNATANLKITKVSNNLLDGAELEATTTTSASTGSLFRYDVTNNQYIYNWGTKSGYSAGTYQLRLDLGDGNGSHTVWVSLRK